jgi:serine/threonine protein kinase
MPQIGETVGNYRLVELLGSGVFGSVYLAENTVLQERQVAVKFLKLEHMQSPLERDTFVHEARLLTQLEHPSILSMIDVGLHNNVPYIVTEYAPNGTLKSYLKKKASQPVTVKEALRILAPIGRALHYAHTRNIVHRDLKPANILFNAENEALLADFGVALMLPAGETLWSDVLRGSPAYMSPEQFSGAASPKCDQYALACIAYELLTGQQPFTPAHSTLKDWENCHANTPAVDPRRLNSAIPKRVSEAILKALAKDRDDRHETVEVFLQALGVSGRSRVARRKRSRPSKPPRKPQDAIRTGPLLGPKVHRFIVAAVLLLVLASVLFAAGSYFLTPKANILLTPANKLEQANFTFTGVPSQPDPSKQQVSAHVLNLSGSQHMSGQATGTIPATKAKGLLRFTNTSESSVTIPSTTLRGSSGVPVSFDGPITIAATGNVTVQSFAVDAGQSGNIKALDFNTQPVPNYSNVVITNLEAFSGGQDAMPELLSQDIDKIAKPLLSSLSQHVSNALQNEVRSNEHSLDQQCHHQQNSDHQPGEHVKTFTVTISLTCSEIVYDYVATRQIATTFLKQVAQSDPDLQRAEWKLNGQVVLTVRNTTSTSAQISLLVTAKGVWVYQFTNQELAKLKQQLVNKSKNRAQAILQQEDGVVSVSIALSNNGQTMPSSVDNITITSKQIPGATN